MFRGMEDEKWKGHVAVISSHSIKTLEVSQSCAGSTGESMLHTGIKIITMYVKKYHTWCDISK